MAEAKRRDSSLLTGYTVQVYAGEDMVGRDLERVTEAIDDEVHDHLFVLARRLEKLYGVHVVAVEEDGTGWIAGDIGKRPLHR